MSSPSLRAAASRLVPRGSRTLVILVVATLLIGVAIWLFSEYVPLVSLLVPIILSSLVLGPRQLPWFVLFVLLVLALVVPSQDINVRHHLRPRVRGAAVLLPPLAPRGGRHPGRDDVRRPAGPDPAPGRDPRPARGVVRRQRAALGRGHPVRGRLRRRLARRGAPAPAPCCCAGPWAGC